jgi:ribonuclease VapC
VILDSSAIIAILQQEPDAMLLAKAIEAAAIRKIATPTYLETCIVLTSRRGKAAIAEFEELLVRTNTEIVPFDQSAAQMAFDAYVKFGKGRNHPAQLNFGDCISYAVSKVEMMPLLFKGDDFRHTDVDCAI